jgi:hypothetical protein
MSGKKRKTEYWSDRLDYTDNKGKEEDNNQGENLWRQNEQLCKQC